MVAINKKHDSVKYGLETVYLGEYIDLKRVQEGIKHYNFLNRDHPLVIRLLNNQYVVLAKFGAVTFWNVSYRLRNQFLKEIKPYVTAKKGSYPYDEDTKVIVGGESDKVTFEKVFIPDLDVNHIKIISHVLSQSVALERYEDEIDSILAEVQAIVESLKNVGKVMLKEKSLLKQIGKVLSVKQTAVAHLSLVDKPEELWESPHLEILHNRLNVEYELRVRFDILDQKVNYLSDVSQMLMNFLAEKRNAFLEIIIIVLIAIDIVLWFIPPFHEVVKYFSELF